MEGKHGCTDASQKGSMAGMAVTSGQRIANGSAFRHFSGRSSHFGGSAAINQPATSGTGGPWRASWRKKGGLPSCLLQNRKHPTTKGPPSLHPWLMAAQPAAMGVRPAHVPPGSVAAPSVRSNGWRRVLRPKTDAAALGEGWGRLTMRLTGRSGSLSSGPHPAR